MILQITGQMMLLTNILVHCSWNIQIMWQHLLSRLFSHSIFKAFSQLTHILNCKFDIKNSLQSFIFCDTVTKYHIFTLTIQQVFSPLSKVIMNLYSAWGHLNTDFHSITAKQCPLYFDNTQDWPLYLPNALTKIIISCLSDFDQMWV